VYSYFLLYRIGQDEYHCYNDIRLVNHLIYLLTSNIIINYYLWDKSAIGIIMNHNYSIPKIPKNLNQFKDLWSNLIVIP